jgi:S1-C subfamily serine protease
MFSRIVVVCGWKRRCTLPTPSLSHVLGGSLSLVFAAAIAGSAMALPVDESPTFGPDSPEALERDIQGVADVWSSRVFLVVADGGPCRPSIEQVRDDPRVLFRRRRVGCAVHVGEGRLLLTTASVIRDNLEVEVFDQTGRQLLARLVGADPYLDLALLEVYEELPAAAAPPPLDVVAQPSHGTLCFVLGNAYGRSLSVAMGTLGGVAVVTSDGVPVRLRRVNAPIFPGDSGGPVLDREGRFLGIVTAVTSAVRPAHFETTGTIELRELRPPLAGISGFAVPASASERPWRDLQAHGRVRRGYLGVQMSLVFEGTPGARILAVAPGGPAAAAGIRPGDRVISYDRQAVRGPRQLCALVAETPPLASVDLRLLRGDQERLLTLEVGEAREVPGIRPGDSTADLGGEAAGAGDSAAMQSVGSPSRRPVR